MPRPRRHPTVRCRSRRDVDQQPLDGGSLVNGACDTIVDIIKPEDGRNARIVMVHFLKYCGPALSLDHRLSFRSRKSAKARVAGPQPPPPSGLVTFPVTVFKFIQESSKESSFAYVTTIGHSWLVVRLAHAHVVDVREGERTSLK